MLFAHIVQKSPFLPSLAAELLILQITYEIVFFSPLFIHFICSYIF